jgi:hypothetical protein
MPPTLPAGPYRTLSTPEGDTFPYYVIPFDKDGICEGPQTQAHLLASLVGVTDIFVFSHGWNNDWTAATARYESFIKGFQQLRVAHSLALPAPYRPLLVGIFWPSQAMAWFDSETGPDFAAAAPAEQDAAANELHASLRERAAELPPDKRERFHALAQSRKLAKGEDQELASLLAGILRGKKDDEAGTDTAADAADLLASAASFETPEPDLDEIGVATSTTAGEPAAAGFVGSVLSVLDPRNIVKPFTVWQMKDRAGTVGAKGVAPLLAALLTRRDATARIHLIGHSFGCKVVMTAVSVMPESDRKIESALLLQGAVSQYAFSPKVPERNVPGGFTRALGRVRRPIMATFSQHDNALTKGFQLSVRRHDDVGELQFAAAGTPSKYGALGGFGPQATVATLLTIKDPNDLYDLAHAEKIVGIDGSRTIGGHGDISNPSTWWAEYCLLTAHRADV